MLIKTDKAQKRKLVEEEVKGAGVMKDEELKLEEIEAHVDIEGVEATLPSMHYI